MLWICGLWLLAEPIQCRIAISRILFPGTKTICKQLSDVHMAEIAVAELPPDLSSGRVGDDEI